MFPNLFQYFDNELGSYLIEQMNLALYLRRHENLRP